MPGRRATALLACMAAAALTVSLLHPFSPVRDGRHAGAAVAADIVSLRAELHALEAKRRAKVLPHATLRADTGNGGVGSGSGSGSSETTPLKPAAERQSERLFFHSRRRSSSGGKVNDAAGGAPSLSDGSGGGGADVEVSVRVGGELQALSTAAVPADVAGVVVVLAATVSCNCPALVRGGDARGLLARSEAGAFVHAEPFLPEEGDTEGLRNVTEAVAARCAGQESCVVSAREDVGAFLAACPLKLSVDYVCRVPHAGGGGASPFAAVANSGLVVFSEHSLPDDGRRLTLRCGAPQLADRLRAYVREAAAPRRAVARVRGLHAEADGVTLEVSAATEAYNAAVARKQVRTGDIVVRPTAYRNDGAVFNVWPIQFSVPSVRFSASVGWKKDGHDFAPSIPGNRDTYGHEAKPDSEADTDYFSEYRHSYYCVTRKKKGWDCLRHYEILATGCVPYFVDIHRLPAATMPFFPRKLVMEAMALPGVTFHDTKEGSFLNRTAYTIDHSVFPKERYFKLAAQIQEHARRHLTSEAMAQYVLDALAAEGGPKRARKVLYIHHCYPDFLGDSLWAGFKELEAQGKLDLVADIVPPREHAIGGADSWHGKLYDMARCEHGRKTAATASARSLSKSRFYEGTKWAGWGNHRSHNAFPRETAVDPQTLPDRIAAKEFDVVVYGTVHRMKAWMDKVKEHYKPNEIAIIYGADGVESVSFIQKVGADGVTFVRETFDEPGGYVNKGEMCRDGPGIADVQGFDCCSLGTHGTSHVAWALPDARAPSWKTCGRENDRCTCSGHARFGHPQTNRFSVIRLSGANEEFQCLNVGTGGPFLDPAPGYAKQCQCLVKDGRNGHLTEQ